MLQCGARKKDIVENTMFIQGVVFTLALNKKKYNKKYARAFVN